MPLKYYEKKLKTMKDKTDRILDLIEDPSNYGDVCIRKQLEDPEAYEIYRTINKTVDALTETSDYDLDSEWNVFVENNKIALGAGNSGIFGIFFRRKTVAVMIIGIASLSLVAAGIGIGISVSERKSKERLEINGVNNDAGEIPTETIEGTVKVQTSTDVEQQTMVYKDESLEKIINDIAHHYGCTVEFRTEAAKDLHLYFQWNRSQTVDETVSQLNHFHQIKITMDDNSLTVE